MIVNANALSLPIASKSVQCVVTSPPYFGLRDYKIDDQIGLEQSPELYVAHLVAVFREVWRVLREDGTIWVNLGDSYATPKVGNTLPDGFEGDRINKPNRCNTNTFIKKLAPGYKPKDLIGIPWMVAFALRADGWYLRSDIIWSKPNPMPESVTDRPTKAHEYLFLLTKQARYFYDADAIKEPLAVEPHAPGNKVSKDAGHLRNDFGTDRMEKVWGVDGLRNRRSVWEIATQPTSYAHFATFPEKLVEPCILAGSRPGDLILDPFAGSGTTGRVAIKHNRQFIGTELNFKYIHEISHRRLTVQRGLVFNA